MKLEITIGNQHLTFLVIFAAAMAIVGLAGAYGGSQPSVMGHSAGELDLAPLYITGGNVGIGTATPATKLDVNGQVTIRGGSPAAGKVLTSDASGLASWQAVGGGVSFGEWIDVTAAARGGATQTAASDGFVFIMSGPPAMSAYTDSTDPPQTLRARTKSSGMGDSHSATMAVRQGDNWRVTGGGRIYWIPLS